MSRTAVQAHRVVAGPPGGESRWSDVTHLLRRAGFGATPSEVAAAAKQGLDDTITSLVNYQQIPETLTPPPDTVTTLGRSRNVADLTVWWLNRMLTTGRPLQEKMTLFWHGHFATAIQKVLEPAYMYRQNQLFRDNALGRFDDLLSAVYKDPAMLIWLDGRRNTKAAPNENWGREVMELFTLGHGNYTEDDVHAMARAFTGWQLDQNGNVIFNPRLHDDGVKTILGQTGNWNGDDAVRILAANSATGSFLASRFWHFFASDDPPTAVINRMAAAYYNSGHSIQAMVDVLFRAPQFYSAETKTGHIKSPTEFVITGLRQLGLTNVDLASVPRVLALLGQELFNPPNVGGWPAGANWINATTMLGRFNYASQLTGDFRRDSPLDTQSIVQLSGAATMNQLVAFITGMLGVQPGVGTAKALLDYAGSGDVVRPDIDFKVRGLVHLVLASPEYQVS